VSRLHLPPLTRKKMHTFSIDMQGPQISWCFSSKLRQATDFESQHKGQIDPWKDWTGSSFVRQITDADAWLLSPD